MSFRIVDWNWCFDPSVSVTASSENASFPASNLTKHFLSKVWRSSGTFVIGSSNKYIDFNEGGGELTAILDEGTYSVTALETEIAAKMNYAGGQSYTISYSSSTGKWTISAGSGFSILWSSGTNTANSIGSDLGFYVASDDASATSHTGMTVAIHTEEYIDIDLKTWSSQVDTFAALFDRLDGSNLSNSAVVKIMGHQTKDFSSPSVTATLTYDDTWESFSNFWTTAQSYRFWRLSIVDPTNPDLYVEIHKIILGNSLGLSQGPERGWKESLTDTSAPGVSVYGDQYFDIKPSVFNREYQFRALLEADKTLLREMYERVGRVTPIFVVLDSAESVFANVSEHMIYGRLQASPYGVTQAAYDYFDYSGFIVTELI